MVGDGTWVMGVGVVPGRANRVDYREAEPARERHRWFPVGGVRRIRPPRSAAGRVLVPSWIYEQLAGQMLLAILVMALHLDATAATVGGRGGRVRTLGVVAPDYP